MRNKEAYKDEAFFPDIFEFAIVFKVVVFFDLKAMRKDPYLSVAIFVNVEGLGPPPDSVVAPVLDFILNHHSLAGKSVLQSH